MPGGEPASSGAFPREQAVDTANDIIRANGKLRRKMMAMRLRHWVAVALVVCGAMVSRAAAVPNPWEQPAAALAEQIAALLGPGQARITLRNLSTVSNDDLPAIRKLLAQDLKARGVVVAGTESASTVRVTLSETGRERLWVAEVVEGSETQVAMVRVDRGATRPAQTAGSLLLRRQVVFTSAEQVLAALEEGAWLVIAEPDALVLYAKSGDGWSESRRLAFVERRGEARDPRGVIVTNGEGFEARAGAMRCEGRFGVDDAAGGWPAQCSESDDPWIWGPLIAPSEASTKLKAFFNAARNSFTGVVTPNLGVDLPPFYAAALVSRAAGNAALLLGGVDGKVQLAESGGLKNVSGTRDWGSDFAVVQSGCGAGVQVIASSSGAAASDSLRAYELPALEAVPASAPLAVEGSVTALWTAPDGKSVYVVVRGAGDRYEVDRVTALCD